MRYLLILLWSLIIGILLAYSQTLPEVLLSLLLFIILCLCTLSSRKQGWLFIALGIFLGWGLSWNYNRIDVPDSKYYVNASFQHRAGIRDIFTINGRLFSVESYERDDSDDSQEDLKYQEQVLLKGNIKKIQYSLDGEVFRGSEMVLQRERKSPGVLTSLHEKKLSLAEQLKDHLGTEAGTLASSLVLGVKDPALRKRQDLLKYLGIIHILSISGFHVNLLEGLLNKSGLKRFSFLLILGYALLVNSVPAWRAALMKLARTFGKFAGRDCPADNQLLIAAFLQLLGAPYLIFSLSFQLTYAATLGLIFFSRIFQEVFYFLPRGRIKEGLIMSTSAMIPCIPILSGIQTDINLAFFAANLVIVPIYSFFCILSFTVMPLLILPLSPAVVFIRILMEWILRMIHFLEYFAYEFLSLRVSWTGASGLYLFAILFLLAKYYKIPPNRQALILTLGGFLLFNLYFLPGTTRVSFIKNFGQARVILQMDLRQYEFVTERMDRRGVKHTAIPVRRPLSVKDVSVFPDAGDFPVVVLEGKHLSPSGDASSDIMNEEYLIILGKVIRLK